MSMFKELMEHHVKKEEGKIFKTAGKVLWEVKFQNIMKQFEQERREGFGELRKK